MTTAAVYVFPVPPMRVIQQNKDRNYAAHPELVEDVGRR